MNFPLEYPLFSFFYWLVNTAGAGGVLVGILGGGSLLAYFLTLRWISHGAKVEEHEVYAYPTPALVGHSKDKRDEMP
jgi:hypothetical protein